MNRRGVGGDARDGHGLPAPLSSSSSTNPSSASDPEVSSPMDSCRFPGDLLRAVLQRLPPPDLARAACVCRLWRVVGGESRWRMRSDAVGGQRSSSKYHRGDAAMLTSSSSSPTSSPFYSDGDAASPNSIDRMLREHGRRHLFSTAESPDTMDTDAAEPASIADYGVQSPGPAAAKMDDTGGAFAGHTVRPPLAEPRSCFRRLGLSGMKQRLLVVANRLPVSANCRGEDQWFLEISAGGLVSALLGVNDVDAKWIGWAGVNVPDEVGQRGLTRALAET